MCARVSFLVQGGYCCTAPGMYHEGYPGTIIISGCFWSYSGTKPGHSGGTRVPILVGLVTLG